VAKTNFTTNNELTVKAWSEKMHRDAVKESYFSKFTTSTSESIVQEKTELSKSRGDEVTIGLRMRLTGAGVEEGTQLEGNEEALTTYSMKVRLAQYRHAVNLLPLAA
jgi:N4-gp56 family major capsid protein